MSKKLRPGVGRGCRGRSIMIVEKKKQNTRAFIEGGNEGEIEKIGGKLK